MKLKFWLAFGESPIFSKKDRTMFYVVPADGNTEMRLGHQGFVEAENIEDARRDMIALVEKWYQHELHMDKLEAGIQVRTERRSIDSKLDAQTTSLTIGSSEPVEKPASNENGILDLLDFMDKADGNKPKP